MPTLVSKIRQRRAGTSACGSVPRLSGVIGTARTLARHRPNLALCVRELGHSWVNLGRSRPLPGAFCAGWHSFDRCRPKLPEARSALRRLQPTARVGHDCDITSRIFVHVPLLQSWRSGAARTPPEGDRIGDESGCHAQQEKVWRELGSIVVPRPYEFGVVRRQWWPYRDRRGGPCQALRFAAKYRFRLHDAFWSAVPFALEALRYRVAGERKNTEHLKIAGLGFRPRDWSRFRRSTLAVHGQRRWSSLGCSMGASSGEVQASVDPGGSENWAEVWKTGGAHKMRPEPA